MPLLAGFGGPPKTPEQGRGITDEEGTCREVHDTACNLVERMLAGVATRRHVEVGEPVGPVAGTAVSKSAVSRRFVPATAGRLAELRDRPLNDRRWLVVYADGFDFGLGAERFDFDGAAGLDDALIR